MATSTARANGEQSFLLDPAICASFNCTDCISESLPTAEPKVLPVWLLDQALELAIKLAIDEMRATKDGTLVRKLLHVSRGLRLRLTREFTPIRLLGLYHRRKLGPEPLNKLAKNNELRAPRDLERFLWDAIHWHFFTDFSQKQKPVPPPPSDVDEQDEEGEEEEEALLPRRVVPPAPPASAAAPSLPPGIVAAPVIGPWDEPLLNVEDQSATYISVDIQITVDEHLSPLKGELVEQHDYTISGGGAHDDDDDVARRVRVNDGCEAVLTVIQGILQARSQPPVPPEYDEFTDDWIACANPYYRAMHGSFGPPTCGAQVLVTCWLHDKGSKHNPTHQVEASKHWRFDVAKAQPDE